MYISHPAQREVTVDPVYLTPVVLNDADKRPVLDSDGNPILDEDGNQILDCKDI